MQRTPQADIDIKKDNVDIIVENENDTVAYQCNDAESSIYTIEIKEAGTYTFFVKGFKAKGSVYFIRALYGTT